MNLSTASISSLEQMLDEYPWFTLARKEYVARHSQMGDAGLRQAMKGSAIFFSSRAGMLKIIRAEKKRDAEKLIQEPVTVHREDEAPKIYVAGGDYFDKEDYEALEESGEAFDTSALVFNPIASALNIISGQDTAPEAATTPVATATPSPEDVKKEKPVKIAEDDCLYTETLASIYLKQEFYQRAIEVYEKLILLYPKKSAYFATLINSVKNIKQ